MKDNNIKRVVIVYLVLIPVVWLLTEVVSRVVYSARLSMSMVKAFEDPNKYNEVKAFMKEHGLLSVSKQERKSLIKKLSPEDYKKFQEIMPVKVEEIMTFGLVLAVGVIVFGLIGFCSGAITKIWLFVGILPGISLLLNNPIIWFRSILTLSNSQKVVLVIGQFLACYAFAFIGVFLCNTMKKRKQQKKESLNNCLHTDAE